MNLIYKETYYLLKLFNYSLIRFLKRPVKTVTNLDTHMKVSNIWKVVVTSSCCFFKVFLII